MNATDRADPQSAKRPAHAGAAPGPHNPHRKQHGPRARFHAQPAHRHTLFVPPPQTAQRPQSTQHADPRPRSSWPPCGARRDVRTPRPKRASQRQMKRMHRLSAGRSSGIWNRGCSWSGIIPPKPLDKKETAPTDSNRNRPGLGANVKSTAGPLRNTLPASRHHGHKTHERTEQAHDHPETAKHPTGALV